MIAEGCRLGDLKCRLADTAGMRRTQDPIELQGITIAKREAEAAQVVFVVFDGSQEMQKEDYDLAEAYGGAHNLAVINKTDLPIKINEQYIKEKFKHTVNISAQTGAGCSAIDGWIRSRFSVADAAAPGCFDLRDGNSEDHRGERKADAGNCRAGRGFHAGSDYN